MAVRDLRVWFILWLAAMVVLVSLPAEGKQSGPLYPDAEAEGRVEPEDFGAWAFVRLNGQRLANPYGDAYPYVADSTGEAWIPLRVVAEAMGGEVEWADGERTVTLTWRGRTATLAIESTTAELNGHPLTLDRAPVLWQDRTMVSPAVIAHVFGAKTEFDPATNQVLIRRAGVLCPKPYCTRA